MEKYLMLALNTGLLSEETMKRMRNEPDTIPVPFYEKKWPDNSSYTRMFPKDSFIGWFIAIPEDEESDEKIPDDLLKIVRFGRQKKAGWIMLDPDAELFEIPNPEENDSAKECIQCVLNQYEPDTGFLKGTVFSDEASARKEMRRRFSRYCRHYDFNVDKNEAEVDIVRGKDEAHLDDNSAQIIIRGLPEIEWNISRG